MTRPVVARAALLAGLVVLAAPTVAAAQVFLASTAHSELSVGPLVISATVTPELGPVSVNVSWSLSVKPPAQLADAAQDLYLLWPAEMAEGTAPGKAEPELVRYVADRGFDILGEGRLTIRRRDRSMLGTTARGETLETTASYVTFVRRGMPAAQIGAGTYIRIPWTESMADPLLVTTLGLRIKNAITPRPATWLEQLFFGPRWVMTSSFNDVGSLSLSVYPMYFEHRDRVIHLARAFSLLIVNFTDSDHLRVDEIVPATATRRGSRTRAGVETVSLALNASDSLTPQVIRVNFSYFWGRIAWRPVVISAIVLLLGNLTGTIMLSQVLGKRLGRTIHLGKRRADGRMAGIVLPPDVLGAIVPQQSTREDVIQLCGPPTEEREVGPDGRRRTLIYRGTRVVTQPRWALGWLATVRQREVEHHEAMVAIEDGRVREVDSSVRRVRDA